MANTGVQAGLQALTMPARIAMSVGERLNTLNELLLSGMNRMKALEQVCIKGIDATINPQVAMRMAQLGGDVAGYGTALAGHGVREATGGKFNPMAGPHGGGGGFNQPMHAGHSTQVAAPTAD